MQYKDGGFTQKMTAPPSQIRSWNNDLDLHLDSDIAYYLEG